MHSFIIITMHESKLRAWKGKELFQAFFYWRGGRSINEYSSLSYK